MRALAVDGAVQHFRQLLLGEDPMEIGAHWQRLYRSHYFEGGRVLTCAMSGIDIALHDLAGKALGVPVYQLLGGKQRDFIPCFATTLARSLDQLISEGQLLMDQGWKVIRTWIGFGEVEAGGQFEPRESLALTAEWLTALREAVGLEAVGGIHLTGVTICSVHGVSSRWQALPGLGWRVSSLVSNRCGLPGLPRMAAVARRLRLSELRPRRRLALGRWPLHVSGVFDTQFGDGRYDLRSDADTLDDMVHRLLAVRHR